MASMFQGCTFLRNIDFGLTGWIMTSKLKNTNNMFAYCSNLTELDLSSWNTSNVTNMAAMFYNCPNLKTIYASADFVTSSATTHSAMFTMDTALV